MRTCLSLLVLLVVSSLVTAPANVRAQDEKPTGLEAVDLAAKAMVDGDYDTAMKLLKGSEGTCEEKDEWQWWAVKGLLHEELRQDKDALACIDKAIELEPRLPFRTRRALLFHMYGQWDKALADLEFLRARNGDTQFLREFRAVIDGPFMDRWPNAYKKLQTTSKLGHFHVVGDVGVTDDEMDRIEEELASLDPEDKRNTRRIDELLKPHPDLEQIGDLLEHVRHKYMRFTNFKDRNWPKGKIFKVFFFRDRHSFDMFQRLTGGQATESTAGFYDPVKRYMQLYAGQGGRKVYAIDEESIDTLIHEGWHMFFHIMAARRPLWMDEGLAEFVAKFELKKDGKDLELGAFIKLREGVYTRYEVMKAAAQQGVWVPFTKWFDADNRTWRSTNPSLAYAQAWSVTYYALKGGNSAFTKDYTRLFWACVEGKNVAQEIAEILPEKKLKQYEEQWIAWVKKQ